MKIKINNFAEEQLQNLLRQLRLVAKMSQGNLAERLGHSQSYVSKYESGNRILNVLELREVCHVLGTNLSEFVEKFEKILNPSQLQQRSSFFFVPREKELRGSITIGGTTMDSLLN